MPKIDLQDGADKGFNSHRRWDKKIKQDKGETKNMVELVEGILSVAVGGVALVSAVTGFIVTLVKNGKNKKLAETAQKKNEVAELLKAKVVEVEQLYSQAAHVLKTVGVAMGEIKKENVMNYLESQCVEKGIRFDKEYWSEEVESLVTVMNVNKG